MAFVRISGEQLYERIAVCIHDMVRSKTSSPLTVLIDGKAAAGKTYMAQAIESSLARNGVSVCRIEGDWFLDSRSERAQKERKIRRRVAGHIFVPEDLHESYWKWEQLKRAVERAKRLAGSEKRESLRLDNIYDRSSGECTGSHELQVSPGFVLIVEGCYLLAHGLESDLSIMLYVNREIGRARKIQREEKKKEGEFPTGPRVGTVLTTWEQIEEPTFFHHLMNHGRKANILVDASDPDSMGVTRFSCQGNGEDELRDALKWDERVGSAHERGNAERLRSLSKSAPSITDRVRVMMLAGQLAQERLEFQQALVDFEKASTEMPDCLPALTQKALMLERMGRSPEALGVLGEASRLLEEGTGGEVPLHPEIEGIRGRVFKQLWKATWSSGRTVKKRQTSALENRGLLLQALGTYKGMFERDFRSYYNGDNATALSALHEHLVRCVQSSSSTGYEGMREGEYKHLLGATRWSAKSALECGPADFWAMTTLGNLAVMEGNRKEAEEIFERAVTESSPKPFEADAVMQQLELFRDLGFQTAACRKALAILRPYLKR